MPEKKQKHQVPKKIETMMEFELQFKVLLPGKLRKLAIFPFNKAGKNKFPLNHWCDTCNFSGVLHLFIENGKPANPKTFWT